MTYEQLREKYRVSNDTIQMCIHSQGYPCKLTKAGEESKAQRVLVVRLRMEGILPKRVSRETGVTVKRVNHLYSLYLRHDWKFILRPQEEKENPDLT